MKIYDITVTGTTADWLTATRGNMPLPVFVRRLLTEIASNPEKFLLLQQFSNPANPEIHEKTTGPEIWEDTDGQIDVFISGVGTGGTLTGVSRYIKGTKGKKDLLTVAVEPTDSPVIAQALAGQELKPGPHKIQGIGAGFIPGNLDLKLVDKVVAAAPEIISHNMETVRRISPEVRSAAKYEVSLSVLARIAAQGVVAKTGIMVGLGETDEEVYTLMDDVRAAGVSVLTIGQYLQPSRKHIPVSAYITPEHFEEYKSIALSKGFTHVESGPLVRSSYHAEKHV